MEENGMKTLSSHSKIFSVVMAGAVAAGAMFVSGCGSTSNYLIPSAAESSGSVALYDRAQALYKQEKYAEAKELFHQYINEYPESHLYKVSLYYLAYCHQQLNEHNEAMSLYAKIVEKYEADDFWVDLAKKRMEQVKPHVKK
jgi:TolA-binding protein